MPTVEEALLKDALQTEKENVTATVLLAIFSNPLISHALLNSLVTHHVQLLVALPV